MMSTTPWTKGAWRIERDQRGRITAIMAGGYFIASAIDNNGGPVNEANAHLIAAAPVMAAALEYARNLIGPDEIIDAALAKARGGARG